VYIFSHLKSRFAPSPASDDRRVMRARLQIVVDSLTATAVFNPIFALIGAAVLSIPHSPFGPVAPWRPALAVGLHLIGSMVALGLQRRFHDIALEQVGHVSRLLLAAQVLFSSMWGALAFLYWVPGNDNNHLYVMTVMSLVAFSVVFARSAYLPVVFTGLAVHCGLFFLRLAIDGGTVAHFMMALMPGYGGYLLAMGRASHRRLNAVILGRFANEDLAAALLRARDEALRKRYEAETANASKTAFLANMSHELRTPLNAILGFSDIIAQRAMGPDAFDRYSEYAADIHSSGTHLLSLINDLLDIAKIEAGKMEIDPRPLEMQAVIEGVVRLMTPRASGRNQTLMMEIMPRLPPVMADERAVRQILINLLANAIKFTPEGGHISVHCHTVTEGGMVLVVADNGPGIAPGKLAHVFEPFSQIDNRFDREGGGTGLGLALVRGLAQLHGGRAWLESEPGKGVKACIYLPSTIGFSAPAFRRAAIP
jgi:two-component system cell cycle sensor histidine kinase PleC